MQNIADKINEGIYEHEYFMFAGTNMKIIAGSNANI